DQRIALHHLPDAVRDRPCQQTAALVGQLRPRLGQHLLQDQSRHLQSERSGHGLNSCSTPAAFVQQWSRLPPGTVPDEAAFVVCRTRTTMPRDKVILAYSGGLDTSVMVPWIGEKYNLDVITFTVDLGQGDDIQKIRQKATKTGAIDAIALDARNLFVDLF